jgi:hypothetical protein
LIIIGACGVLYASRPALDSAALHLHSTGTLHPEDPQTFIADTTVCASGYPLSGEEDPTFYPALPCGDAYDLPAGGTRTQYVDTVLQKGNRIPTQKTIWLDKAFGSGADAAIADGTLAGGTYASVNIGCDDTRDFLVNSSSALPMQYLFQGTPVDVREQTTAFGATTGFNGRDERLFEDLLPPAWPRHVRYRSEFDFVAVGGTDGVPLASPISLNAITATPPWGNVRGTMLFFGADAVAPDSQLILCFDTPHASHWELGAPALLTYPATPGLYAVWVSFVSMPGTRDEQKQDVGYHTSCKHVGGFFPDADDDCLPDTADSNDDVYDSDGDGLIDGIDIAWAGAGPCPAGGLPPDRTRDCDGDGRQDAEEHFAMTNPRSADTDGDGFVDSGLNFDCDGDGAPEDMPRQNVQPSSGVNRVRIRVMYCKPDGLHTMQGNRGGQPWGNVHPPAPPPPSTIDNCPNHSGAQTNSSTAFADLDALPVPGDTNGRFAGAADATHPDARFSGDRCDPDDDNDGVVDLVEGLMHYNPAPVPPDAAYCNTAAVGTPAPTSPNARDSDVDGSIDGVECQAGKNPADATSRVTGSLSSEQQTFFRLTQLTQPYAGTPLLMNLDDGTTIIGVPEVRGLGPSGGSQVDHDRDGCVDEVESVEVDGNRIAGEPDRLAIARAALGVSTFAPPGSITPEEIRTADIDYNGALGDADRLASARIVLTSSLPAVPDYILDCRAVAIGYDAT